MEKRRSVHSEGGSATLAPEDELPSPIARIMVMITLSRVGNFECRAFGARRQPIFSFENTVEIYIFCRCLYSVARRTAYVPRVATTTWSSVEGLRRRDLAVAAQ